MRYESYPAFKVTHIQDWREKAIGDDIGDNWQLKTDVELDDSADLVTSIYIPLSLPHVPNA